MHHCIVSLLRATGATVVLVTHQTQWLGSCDQLLLLEEGKIVQQGLPAQLGFSSTAANVIEDIDSAGGADAGGDASASGVDTNVDVGAGAISNAGTPADTGTGAELMSEEERDRGTVSFSVWIAYLRALSRCGLFWIFLFFGIGEALSVGSKWWLTQWSSDAFNESAWFYVDVYTALMLGSLSLVIFRAAVLILSCIEAGRVLHQSAAESVVASPVVFFDTTPLGRIINRFSNDVEVVDCEISWSWSYFLWNVFELIGCILQIALNSTWSLLMLLPLGAAFGTVARHYRHSSRELQRLVSISQSPVYAAFGEALAGASTIRAFGARTRFAKENRERFDRTMQANFVQKAATRWLSVRLEALGAIVASASAALAIYVCQEQRASESASGELGKVPGGVPSEGASGDNGSAGVEAGLAGKALSAALLLTEDLSWLLRFLTELETQMVSVERLLHYIHLPPESAPAGKALADEPAEHLHAHEPTTSATRLLPTCGASRIRPAAGGVLNSWPHRGAVELVHIAMRYRPELPLVLRDFSLSVKAGEKIGIVGRTGAGKSSVLQCLLRMTPLSAGEIFIGGVDIATVPLHTLRSALAIIPQVTPASQTPL